MKHFIAAMVIACLCACNYVGLPTAQTFNEKAAVALGTTTSIRETATTLLTSDRITPDDADNVQQQADLARSGVDIARSIGATDPTAADNKIDATLAILKALQAYIASKAPEVP